VQHLLPGGETEPYHKGNAADHTERDARKGANSSGTGAEIEPFRLLASFPLATTTIAEDLPINVRGMIGADRPKAEVALRIDPAVPVAWVRFEDRLELLIAAVHATANKWHGYPLGGRG